MLPYWLFFLIPAGVILANQRLAERSQVWAWALIWLFFSLAIGLRFQVGGDWGSYIRLLEIQAVKSLWEVVAGGDPGYYLLNWLVVQAGGSIYWVNTACGMIVMAGVVRFARSQPLPWLALLVAVPYLIIVVGMGYTRQSAALGFFLIGLVSLGNGDGKGKWLLRQVLYRYVPEPLMERPKMGFAVPIGEWLKGPLREWAETLLDEQRLRNEGFFRPEPIRKMWQAHLSGKGRFEKQLWCVLMFQAWLEGNA